MPTAVRRLLVAAVAAGVVLGVAGRLLMRGIAREAGLPGGFSLGGSLEVALFGLVLGAPLAAGFWLLRPRLSWPRPLAGLALGGLATTWLSLLPPSSARSALAATPDTPVITWLGFGLLLTGWAVGLEALTAWIWQPLQRPRASVLPDDGRPRDLRRASPAWSDSTEEGTMRGGRRGRPRRLSSCWPRQG